MNAETNNDSQSAPSIDQVTEPDPPPDGFRCGYVAIVGRPNVGKSTLLNRILGQKLSITSSKPQTTRHQILGIKTTERAQALYVDTPGMHSARGRALNQAMNRAADGALLGVDLVLFVIEAMKWTREDEHVLQRVVQAGLPSLLLVNKVDRLKDKERLLPFLAEVQARHGFAEIVPISARREADAQRIQSLVESALPTGRAVYDEEQITDRSVRFLAAETIREKLMRRLAKELPHRLGVEVERFEDGETATEIGAVIWLDRKSHKPIVVGKDGGVLKEVGTRARRDLEIMLERHVRLELWVKVSEGWSDDDRAVVRMGYGDAG